MPTQQNESLTEAVPLSESAFRTYSPLRCRDVLPRRITPPGVGSLRHPTPGGGVFVLGDLESLRRSLCLSLESRDGTTSLRVSSPVGTTGSSPTGRVPCEPKFAWLSLFAQVSPARSWNARLLTCIVWVRLTVHGERRSVEA